MFYCDPCAKSRNWPYPTLARSVGTCEICNKRATCNDRPSRLLPHVPRVTAVDEVGDRIPYGHHMNDDGEIRRNEICDDRR